MKEILREIEREIERPRGRKEGKHRYNTQHPRRGRGHLGWRALVLLFPGTISKFGSRTSPAFLWPACLPRFDCALSRASVAWARCARRSSSVSPDASPPRDCPLLLCKSSRCALVRPPPRGRSSPPSANSVVQQAPIEGAGAERRAEGCEKCAQRMSGSSVTHALETC